MIDEIAEKEKIEKKYETAMAKAGHRLLPVLVTLGVVTVYTWIQGIPPLLNPPQIAHQYKQLTNDYDNTQEIRIDLESLKFKSDSFESPRNTYTRRLESTLEENSISANLDLLILKYQTKEKRIRTELADVRENAELRNYNTTRNLGKLLTYSNLLFGLGCSMWVMRKNSKYCNDIYNLKLRMIDEHYGIDVD